KFSKGRRLRHRERKILRRPQYPLLAPSETPRVSHCAPSLSISLRREMSHFAWNLRSQLLMEASLTFSTSILAHSSISRLGIFSSPWRMTWLNALPLFNVSCGTAVRPKLQKLKPGSIEARDREEQAKMKT